MSIDEYLLKNPHKKLLYNPLAAEFGIENMSQMNQFINNQLPKFKMVSACGTSAISSQRRKQERELHVKCSPRPNRVLTA